MIGGLLGLLVNWQGDNVASALGGQQNLLEGVAANSTNLDFAALLMSLVDVNQNPEQSGSSVQKMGGKNGLIDLGENNLLNLEVIKELLPEGENGLNGLVDESLLLALIPNIEQQGKERSEDVISSSLSERILMAAERQSLVESIKVGGLNYKNEKIHQDKTSSNADGRQTIPREEHSRLQKEINYNLQELSALKGIFRSWHGKENNKRQIGLVREQRQFLQSMNLVRTDQLEKMGDNSVGDAIVNIGDRDIGLANLSEPKFDSTPQQNFIGMGLVSNSNINESHQDSLTALKDNVVATRSLGERVMLEVVDKVKQAIVMNKIPGGVRLRLHPPELGSLQIDLRYNQEQLEIHMLPEKQLTHHLLKEHVQELRQHIMDNLQVLEPKIEISHPTKHAGQSGQYQDFSQGQRENPYREGADFKGNKKRKEEKFFQLLSGVIDVSV